jgi:hypothetical protein
LPPSCITFSAQKIATLPLPVTMTVLPSKVVSHIFLSISAVKLQMP